LNKVFSAKTKSQSWILIYPGWNRTFWCLLWGQERPTYIYEPASKRRDERVRFTRVYEWISTSGGTPDSIYASSTDDSAKSL